MRKVVWRVGLAVMVVGLAGPARAAGNHEVTISHAKFVPQQVTIAPGDTVTWNNEDHDSHSVTADDGSFDSHPDCTEETPDRCLAPGGTWSHTFSEPGRHPYRSRTEGQKGVVVVKG
jgi:plastocyanin